MAKNPAILVVEDERIVAEDIKRTLLKFDYIVPAIASSGQAALEAVEEFQPDLILMDIVIKGEMNGIETADEISKRWDIPVIFVTAYADKSTLDKAKKTGPFGYILKPFEGKELHGVIEMALYKHHTEKKLKENEAWLTTTLKSIGDGVITTDSNGIITFINNVAQDLTEWDDEEAIGQPFEKVFNMINEETGLRCENPVNHALEKNMIISLAEDTVLVTYSGKKVPIDDSCAPIRNDRGEIIGAILVFRDITEQKIAQREIRKSQARLELTLEATSDALWDWNIAEDILYFSPRFYELLGYENNDIQAPFKTWHAMYHPDDLVFVEQNINDHLNDKTPSYEFEARMIHKDDSYKWVLARGKVVERDSNNNPVRLIGVVIDITERRALENKIIESQKMDSIGNLAGGVAHDFNNMLGGIMGYASLLSRSVTDKKQKIYVDHIISASESAAELTKQLLAFGRRGKKQVKGVNLNQTVQKVKQLIKRSIDKKITIKLGLSKDLYTIDGDPAQIEQVVMNLCVNAAEAIDSAGTVTLKTEKVTIDEMFCRTVPNCKPGLYTRLTITDTGCGIDKETQKRIFEPFFTTKKEGEKKGTGLGLATVYGIIRNHGGFITLYSEIGQGTEFKAYFPAGKKVVEEQLTTTTEKIAKGHGTVLIVEDEDIVRNMIKEMVASLGYTVATEPGGLPAIEYFKINHKKIDAVIIDMVMPDLGGGETFMEMKKINPDVKALLSSGYALDARSQAVLDLGMKGFLQKPYSVAELAKKLVQILDS